MRSIPTQSRNASPRANTAAHRKQFIQFVLPLNLLLWLCDLLMFDVLHPACFLLSNRTKHHVNSEPKCIGHEGTKHTKKSPPRVWNDFWWSQVMDLSWSQYHRLLQRVSRPPGFPPASRRGVTFWRHASALCQERWLGNCPLQHPTCQRGSTRTGVRKHSWWWNPLKWPWIRSWGIVLARIKNLLMVANDDVVGGGVKPSSVPRNVKEEVAPALEYARSDLSLHVFEGRLTSEKTFRATQYPVIEMLHWTGSAPPILANSDRNAMCRVIFKLKAQNSFKGKIEFGWGIMWRKFGICHVVWIDAGHEILQWWLAVFSADVKCKFCLVVALRHTLLKDWLVLCDRVMIWKKPHTDQSWMRLSRTYKFDLVVVAFAPPLFALSVWSSIARPSCACHVGTGSLEAEHRCVLTRLGIQPATNNIIATANIFWEVAVILQGRDACNADACNANCRLEQQSWAKPRYEKCIDMLQPWCSMRLVSI